MRDDRFDKAPGFERLLGAPERAVSGERVLKGVPSPGDLQAFRERRNSRKIVEAKQVLQIIQGETEPDGALPDDSYFVRLARAVPVVSGQGADYFDPEQTITLVG